MPEKLTNPCLTMHQPWASLLVHGIKRIEGRSWPAPLRGRLWIHAAAKVPDPETIKAMEEFYREIYRIDGVTDIKFPEHYPVSQLLGCVSVVGCVKCEELVCWEELPNGVRMEGQTDFCWLCEDPNKLVVPFEMRGYQGVYNLERKIFAAAIRGLRPMQSPLPVKFPLPDSANSFSLKPGALTPFINSSKSNLVKTPGLDAAIARARAAATQFTRKGQGARGESSQPKSDSGEKVVGYLNQSVGLTESIHTEPQAISSKPNLEKSYHVSAISSGAGTVLKQTTQEEYSRLESNQSVAYGRNQVGRLERNRPETIASSSRIFAAAVRGLKPS